MSDLKFSLDAEDTSLLAQYAIGASLSSEVRVVRNIYRNNENGYSIYDAEDTSYRLLKLSGYFPTPLRLDGYYRKANMAAPCRWMTTRVRCRRIKIRSSRSCALSLAWIPGRRISTEHWDLKLLD